MTTRTVTRETKLRPWTKITLPFVVLAAAGAATTAIIRARKPPAKVVRERSRPLVRVVTAKRRTVRLRVESEGTIEPRTRTRIVAQVAGKVVEVAPALASGAFFAKGDLLLRLEAQDYEAALAEAQARVARAERVLAVEEKEAELAKDEWERAGRDEPMDPLAAHLPQLAEARASLLAAKASASRAELDVARTRVEAPYAGRATGRSVDVGEVVLPGTPLASIHAIDRAEIVLPVHDSALAFLDVEDLLLRRASDGPQVRLHTTFGGKPHEWFGHVARVEGEIDPSTRMVRLVAEIDDPYGRKREIQRPVLPFGIFVEAEIEGFEVAGLVSLPRIAVRGENEVLVVDDEDRLWRRKVRIHRRERDVVHVSGGLSDADRVCVSPLEALVDGMHVQVEESAK